LELLRRRRKDAIFFLERKNLKNPNQIKGIKRKPPGSDQKSPVLVSAPEVGGAVFSSSPCACLIFKKTLSSHLWKFPNSSTHFPLIKKDYYLREEREVPLF